MPRNREPSREEGRPLRFLVKRSRTPRSSSARWSSSTPSWGSPPEDRWVGPLERGL